MGSLRQCIRKAGLEAGVSGEMVKDALELMRELYLVCPDIPLADFGGVAVGLLYAAAAKGDQAHVWAALVATCGLPIDSLYQKLKLLFTHLPGHLITPAIPAPPPAPVPQLYVELESGGIRVIMDGPKVITLYGDAAQPLMHLDGALVYSNCYYKENGTTPPDVVKMTTYLYAKASVLALPTRVTVRELRGPSQRGPLKDLVVVPKANVRPLNGSLGLQCGAAAAAADEDVACVRCDEALTFLTKDGRMFTIRKDDILRDASVAEYINAAAAEAPAPLTRQDAMEL